MFAKKPTKDMARAAFQSYLNPDETLQQTASGVKQPHMMLIIGLMFLAILPGIIAGLS